MSDRELGGEGEDAGGSLSLSQKASSLLLPQALPQAGLCYVCYVYYGPTTTASLSLDRGEGGRKLGEGGEESCVEGRGRGERVTQRGEVLGEVPVDTVQPLCPSRSSSFSSDAGSRGRAGEESQELGGGRGGERGRGGIYKVGEGSEGREEGGD